MTFNHKAIAELSNMAALRNHLFLLSQNRNISTVDEANQLRSVVSKIDREIVRRTIANDFEATAVEPNKKATTKKITKKATTKKTVVKRSDLE